MKKQELTKLVDLPLVEELQSKILNLTKSLPEFKHSKKMFGRTNSQYTSQLMSMTMLGDGPYHFMKQCSAQIDNKTSALQGVYFKMKKAAYKIKKWEEKGTEYSLLLAEEARVGLMEASDGISHAIREIKMYQDAYEEIREHHGIDENWDEADFNKLEEENHIRMAFRLAIRRLMENGRIDRSTAEYMEQNGIHPMSGERVARQYHQEVTKLLDEGKAPSVKHFYDFLDSMVEMFKGSHKNTMDRIGIKKIIRENSVMLTHDHEDMNYFLENHGFQKTEKKQINDK
jgi:hypothetical protein|tara:strand:- start:913 stop:1770 length:858 start_codon:yes stop_codon:yes gene_type:complete